MQHEQVARPEGGLGISQLRSSGRLAEAIACGCLVVVSA